MRITLINLARAPERLEKMARQFSSQGLAFERLEARDGCTLTDSDRALVDDKKRSRITPYPLSDNEIGCWLSHRAALETIASGSAPMAAVIEDDAELSHEFALAIEAIEKIGPRFDFIFLHRKFKKGEIFVPFRQLLPALSMGRIGPAHMGAIGYVASAKGARAFLSYAPRFAHAVDKEIHRYWANGLDIYGLERPIVTHEDGGHSYIEETREQQKPSARPRYADADSFRSKLLRGLTRFSDSMGKRRAWAAYQKRETET